MDYWTNKRVTVTGGAGMVGSRLVEFLLAAGAAVTVLDNLSRGKTYIEGAKYLRGDAGEVGPCLHAFAAAEVVFNLAAHVAGVLYNQAHQAEMFNLNMRLQSIPVVAAEQCHVPVFVQMSSVCVYAPEYNNPAIETNGQLGEPIGANTGYSWAKRMGERAALWSGIERVVIVRPSNIYGPRDYFDDRAHVIPALIRKCLEQDTIQVHGTGNEEREFIYVDDVARGLMAAAEHGTHGEAYNIGDEEAISIRELLLCIQHTTDTTEKPIAFTGGNAGDEVRWSNCDKAYNDLDHWSSHIGLDDGLRETVAWYRDHQPMIAPLAQS